MKKGLEIVSFWFGIAIFSVLFSLFCLLFIAFFEFNFDYSRAFLELSKEGNESLKFMYIVTFGIVLTVYGGFKILTFKSQYLNSKGKTYSNKNTLRIHETNNRRCSTDYQHYNLMQDI